MADFQTKTKASHMGVLFHLKQLTLGTETGGCKIFCLCHTPEVMYLTKIQYL